ncbi:PilT protein domain protein [mine drainage metagenome]|uniref:PilT protein domain protein n=1 Tax=mine drainage metagenome TaxID=410659 RepID=T0YT76_9ZZZZ
MRLTIDSYAWIEVIRGSPLGTATRARIEAAGACFTPAIALAEVGHRCRRDGFGDRQIEHELTAMTEASVLVPITSGLATAASSATEELRERVRSLRLRPAGLTDGLILATARGAESQLLTGDPHFRGLREILWLG